MCFTRVNLLCHVYGKGAGRAFNYYIYIVQVDLVLSARDGHHDIIITSSPME